MRRWMLALLLLGALPKETRAEAPPASEAEDSSDVSPLTGLHLLQEQELDMGGGLLLRLEVGADMPRGSDAFSWKAKLSARLFLFTTGGKQGRKQVDSLPLEMPRATGMLEAKLEPDALPLSSHVRATGVKLGVYSDGEGSEVVTHYVLVLDRKLQLAVSAREEPNSGSGYPASKSRARVETLESRSHWLSDIVVSKESTSVANEDSEPETRRDEDFFCWDGHRYGPCEPQPPGPELVEAKASSVLKEKPLAADFHAPERAVDGLESTAWVEGVKGPGVGQSLQLRFASARTLEALEVLAACGVSPERRAQNHRLKQVRLSFTGGAPEVVDLRDTTGWQTLTLAQPRETSELKVEILSVYPGSKYDDACISELVPVWTPPPPPGKETR